MQDNIRPSFYLLGLGKIHLNIYADILACLSSGAFCILFPTFDKDVGPDKGKDRASWFSIVVSYRSTQLYCCSAYIQPFNPPVTLIKIKKQSVEHA